MKKGWETKTLDEVLSVIKNGINCKQNKKGDGEKITRIETISNANINLDKVGFASLTKTEKQKYRLQKGDILFSHINSPIHVGKTAIFDSDEDVYHGVNLLLIRPKDLLVANYLELYFKYIFQSGYWSRTAKQAVNQASVNQQDVKRLKIHFPSSKVEQKHIVKILDEKFETIEKLKKVTEEQILETEELFLNSIYQALTKNTQNWNTDLLKNCFRLKSGDNLTTKNIVAGKIPVYGGNGVMGYHNDSNLAGDNVVIGRVGALCGIARNVVGDMWLTDNAFKVVDCKYDFNNVFLAYLLNFVNLRNYAREMAQPVISNTSLKDISLCFPEISEQKKIAEKLDLSRKKTGDLKKLFKEKLKDVEELKKSYLEQAFAGKL